MMRWDLRTGVATPVKPGLVQLAGVDSGGSLLADATVDHFGRGCRSAASPGTRRPGSPPMPSPTTARSSVAPPVGRCGGAAADQRPGRPPPRLGGDPPGRGLGSLVCRGARTTGAGADEPRGGGVQPGHAARPGRDGPGVRGAARHPGAGPDRARLRGALHPDVPGDVRRDPAPLPAAAPGGAGDVPAA